VLEDFAILRQQRVTEEDVHPIDGTVVPAPNDSQRDLLGGEIAITQDLLAREQFDGVIILQRDRTFVLPLLQDLVEQH
jgi:hypothetical protein